MRSANIGELYSITLELLESNHPVAKISVYLITIFFIIPIVLGSLILLIEGNPNKKNVKKKCE
jgi:hypothetical protein